MTECHIPVFGPLSIFSPTSLARRIISSENFRRDSKRMQNNYICQGFFRIFCWICFQFSYSILCKAYCVGVICFSFHNMQLSDHKLTSVALKKGREKGVSSLTQ